MSTVQLATPISSRSNSIQSSSKASRMRAASLKSNGTIMTTDSVDIETNLFRDNYMKLQDQIDESKNVRDKLESELRKLQVEYDFKRKKIKEIETNLNIREKLLNERDNLIPPEHLSILAQISQDRQIAEQTRKSKMQEIDDLKFQIETISDDMLKLMDKSLQLLAFRNDIPVLEAENKSLLASIQRKTQRIMAYEEFETKQSIELNRLKGLEKEMAITKNELDNQYSDIEERHLDAIRTLAEPIDSTEYEEKIVEELENELKQTTERFEAIKKHEETDENERGISNIIKMEQENEKRRANIESKKASLENQKAIREAKLIENQKKHERQKESLEKFKQQIAKQERLKKEQEAALNEEEEIEDSPFQQYIPAGKIRNENDLLEQIQLYEKQNQEKLDKTLNEISQMEQKFNKEKELENQKWEKLMTRADTYTKRLAKKESVSLSISELEETRDELSEKLKTLTQTKATLARRKQTTISQTEEKVDQEPTANNDNYNTILTVKQESINQKTRDLEDKQSNLGKLKEEIERLEKEVEMKQRRVSKVESDVAKYKELMSNAVDNLNESSQTLDNTISNLEIKDQVE